MAGAVSAIVNYSGLLGVSKESVPGRTCDVIGPNFISLYQLDLGCPKVRNGHDGRIT